MVFTAELGMIDRGADLGPDPERGVEAISQYPHEKEILMPPLTGVQVLKNGKHIDGKRLVVEVRLTSNLLSQTIEQVRRASITFHAYSRYSHTHPSNGLLSPLPAGAEQAHAARQRDA